MKMIFATDVDGTILTDQGIPHTDTNNAFKYAKSKGSYIVIATGRSYSRTQILLAMMPDVDFFICNNGSLIYDVKNKKIVYITNISPEIYITMIDFAKKENFSLTMHTEKNTYTWPDKKFDKNIVIDNAFEIMMKNHITLNKNSKFIFNGEQITQLSLFGSEEKCILNFPLLKKEFSKKQNVYLTNGVFLDVNPLDTSKWTGLKFLSKLLDIELNNIATFGDSGNDLEMLVNANNYGFPMENSTDDLRKILSPKIGNNNTNAIAKKIIELVDN